MRADPGVCLGRYPGSGLGSCQVGREAWSAMFVIWRLVDVGFLMTTNGGPAGSSARASTAVPAIVSSAASRRAALSGAGTAQLIIISELLARAGLPQKKV